MTNPRPPRRDLAPLPSSVRDALERAVRAAGGLAAFSRREQINRNSLAHALRGAALSTTVRGLLRRIALGARAPVMMEQ